jgi:glyoxylase-like metal-dependent hydrolase (beta-lactamase superfamily II)
MVRKVYSGRVVFHDGDAEIAPGVTAHKLGGHSRGLQCVRVMTETGPVVLASDGTHFYENFEMGKVFPIVVDVEDVLNGYARWKRFSCHIVRTRSVLQRIRNDQTQGVVHRSARLDA